MDKLIIDTPARHWANSMIVVTRVKAENPDQKTGTGNAIEYPYESFVYSVVRNKNSYTVRLKQEEDRLDNLEQAAPPEAMEE